MERGLDKRKLTRYENTEITLSEEQHTEMCDIMDAVDWVGVDDLQRIFEEGESHGVGNKLKENARCIRGSNWKAFRKIKLEMVRAFEVNGYLANDYILFL